LSALAQMYPDEYQDLLRDEMKVEAKRAS